MPPECRRRGSGARRKDPCSPPSAAARPGSTSGWTWVLPTRAWTPRSSAESWRRSTRSRAPAAVAPGRVVRRPGRRRSMGPAGRAAARARGAVRRPVGRAARRAGRTGVLDRAARDVADLSLRPVGRQRPADGGRRSLRHRLGEQRTGGSEPGARLRAVRVRPRRRRPRPRAGQRLPGGRRARRRSAGADTSRCSSRSSGTSPRWLRWTGWNPTRAPPTEQPRPRGSARSSTSRTPGTCSTPC